MKCICSRYLQGSRATPRSHGHLGAGLIGSKTVVQRRVGTHFARNVHMMNHGPSLGLMHRKTYSVFRHLSQGLRRRLEEGKTWEIQSTRVACMCRQYCLGAVRRRSNRLSMIDHKSNPIDGKRWSWPMGAGPQSPVSRSSESDESGPGMVPSRRALYC